MNERDQAPSQHQDVQGHAVPTPDANGPLLLKPLVRLAAQRGDVEYVAGYLANGGSVDACDQKGRTLLVIASAAGQHEVCRLLTSHSEGIDAFNLPTSDLAPQHPADVSDTPNRQSDQPGSTAPAAWSRPPEELAFESEFFQPWAAEIPVNEPSDDISLRTEVVSAREDMKRHVIIDKDEDWRELALQLPDRHELRAIQELTNDYAYEIFTALVVRAQTEGAFSHHHASETARELDNATHGSTLDRLLLLMGELDATLEEEEEWLPNYTLGDYEAHTEAIDDAVEFMQDLASLTNDPEFHLARHLSTSILLDREGEERIGRVISVSLHDAYRAIACDRNCVMQLQALASDVGENVVAIGQITHLDLEDESDSMEETEESPEDNDQQYGQTQTPARLLQDMIFRAVASCTAWCKSEEDGGKSSRSSAIADVSALELTASAVRRIDLELRRHGKGNRQLNQIVGRIDLAEYELFHSNLKLAVSVANKYAWSELSAMDRFQETAIGLLKAIDRFDFTKGTKFSTYAMWWLKQSMHRSIADRGRLIRLPAHVVEKLGKLRRAARLNGSNQLYDHAPELLAEISGMTVAQTKTLISVSEDATYWSDNSMLLKEVLSATDDSADPELWTDTLMRRRAVRSFVDELPAREAEVIRYRFGLDDGRERTLEEVGQMYGLTRERIRQIEKKAMKKLRDPSRQVYELVNGTVNEGACAPKEDESCD